MIKISALNEESEEESGSEEEVTREALEQIALQQYAKALELQRKGSLKEATQLLKDLLDTELLYDVKKPVQVEKTPGPLFNLKYLSYKNLASMLSAADDVDAAIDAYCAASELDDTDVSLWYRLGQLCMRGKRYEMALHSFQRGSDCNPRHWPCLDKIVTLLLGLGSKEECIATIYDALQLDPGYLRGLAYRKHIFTVYPHIKDYMEYQNSMYKWNEKEDEPFDEIKAEILIKEAEEIHETFLEQQRAEQFKYVIPELKFVKPISSLSWKSVGDSLVHMHHYMTENLYSHACRLEIVFEKDEQEVPMEVCEEPKEAEIVENKPKEESNIETEKVAEIVSENENNDLSDKDKAATDTEKVESDVEAAPVDTTADAVSDAQTPENNAKTQKKNPVRRRGSALRFLQQWEWCKNRRSGRKKPANKQEQEDNIYETLRKMLPVCLSPEIVQIKENQTRETSPDTTFLEKMFDEKEKPEENEAKQYFESETEQKDVKDFIKKYTQNKRDIIDILKDYLSILAEKWREKWPEGLPSVFIEANKCYMNHVDVPTCTSDNNEDLVQYTTVNILVEEFSVNEKLVSPPEGADGLKHNLSVVEAVGIILSLKPHIFVSTDCLELLLRFIWVKFHIHMLNKCNEFAIDCLYQLQYEFEAMGEHHDTYKLEVVNFTFKPAISETEILAGIKFLERNKKLATVLDLFERGSYEEVLTIVIDSFEHYKLMARSEEEEMSLDFAVQLSVILDTYWALNKIDDCLKWSLTCLHEALKHYFRHTTGSPEYEKWMLTVVKILCCMEHILTTEGLACLDVVSQKELSQGLEDLIRIIGHQVETNGNEMPFNTVVPWIIMHYILQREEDQGRGRVLDKDKDVWEEVPNPLLVLFIAHEQLGTRGWCCNSEGKLLFFILDTVVPRLRSPSLSKAHEEVCKYLEQCIFCLYGHPGKKTKLKYLIDHNVSTYPLDWPRAQQLYEIFKPPQLPELEGKNSAITTETEQLFHRILALLPPEYDPTKYLTEIDKYIKGLQDNLPNVPSLIPYKMRDIYFLLGDYYFKKEEGKLGIKFNMLDVAVNGDRLESWAEISLAKAYNLDRILNSCKNLNNEREYLNPAKSVIRCFKRALELDPRHCIMWIEYGLFVYTVHSFCSRLLKQASESLSMEDFEFLEKQKENMLDTTQKCFIAVINEMNTCTDSEKANEEAWLHFYMLGKVAEKQNKPPSLYLDYYMKAVKSLQEKDATYPLKINYNTPTHLCIEVLELHYRIHASILKYMEQHESKPIPASVGKVFSTCIEEWKKGPFTRKAKKDCTADTEATAAEPKQPEAVHAANILKRSISDAGEEESHEAKRLKLESAAAKVRRSASYDTERIAANKEPIVQNVTTEAAPALTADDKKDDVIVVEDKSPSASTLSPPPQPILAPPPPQPILVPPLLQPILASPPPQPILASSPPQPILPPPPPLPSATDSNNEQPMETDKPVEETKEETDEKTGESSSSTSSSSSSDSSSSESSSDSSSDSRDSSESSKSSCDNKQLTDEEIMKIVSSCLGALEDCTSRFPLHYKALYRLAHYHFYYKKGKDIERCRDLMLSSFMSRSGHKLGGLFSERKPSNFFNNIWKIPVTEVERAGGFAFHMNRSVLLTLEILKEIDDHKTLLDISLHLQRIPEPDKKYLRDSDREELAQQAFSLCVQSLKGQLTKFGQQADLKSNEIERQALKSLMLDIYRAYQRVQKQQQITNNKTKNPKQFTNLLIEGYKLVTTEPIAENANLVDISLKYCQKLIQRLKHEATMAIMDKTQNAHKKQAAKAAVVAETAKASTSTAPVVHAPKPDPPPKAPAPHQPTTPAVGGGLPKMSPQEMAAAFQSYLPMLNDPVLSQQTAAALSLSYLSNISALAGYSSLQSSLQSSIQNTLQNSFQAEFYRQFLGQNFSSFLPPVKQKQKRGPKPGQQRSQVNPQMKMSKSYSSTASPSTTTKSYTSTTQTTSSKSFSGTTQPTSSKSFSGTTLPASSKSFSGTTLPTSSSKSFSGTTLPTSSSKSFSGTTLPTSSSKSFSGTTLPTSSSKSFSGTTLPTSSSKSFSGTTLPTSSSKSFSGTTLPTSSSKSFSGTTLPTSSKPFTGTTLPTSSKSFSSTTLPTSSSKSFSGSTLPTSAKSFTGTLPTTTSKSYSANTLPASSSKSFSGTLQIPPAKTQSTAVPTIQKSTSTPMAPSMGTVLQNLPASMSANLSSFGGHSTSHSAHIPAQAHMSSACTVNAAIHTKPPMPHQQVSPGKTLQEKLAERQKHLPITKSQDINASISKLPSSLTIIKTSVPKPVSKKPEAKKTLPFSNERPKPITSDEVIVLDDD